MKIDVTLRITPDMLKEAESNTAKSLIGHMGTHFDVMNKDFPLDYTERRMIVFDVSDIGEREIACSDIDLSKVGPDMFVAFRTGYIDIVKYGTQQYFKEHPQLSHELIDALLEKNISIIGVDCAGIRRSREHIPADQKCADQGVFVIENLCNLEKVTGAEGEVIAHTYPVSYTGMTGLPCRVVAEI